MKKQNNINQLLEISKILAEITDYSQIENFLKEILTPKELDDLSLRWQLLKDLQAGETQRTIASKHGISLCKITRGSKLLKNNNSIIKEILNKYYGGNDV